MGLFKSDIKSTLKEDFLKSISTGLKRKSATTCSRWAEQYRVIYDRAKNQALPWRFTYHPWLREMHDSRADINIGQKSAQMGYTETVLNITFYNIDMLSRDCLYVLPSLTPDASDFSLSRFNGALELSPHLNGLFSDVKNVRHKRAGAANVYIRGSKSRSHLKSIPVGFLVLDEVNEMPKKNIALAMERMSGQMERAAWLISTPTVEDAGISIYYNRSTQNHFYFRCPSCSRYIELTYPESIVITGQSIDDPEIENTHLICTLCKATLPHESKSEWLADNRWVPSFSNRDQIGWHISQLYSCADATSPPQIARSYFAALEDPSEEQEFYNSKLGLTHEVEDSRVTDNQLQSVIGSYIRHQSMDYGVITMGVDVNYPWLNFEIDQWHIPANASGVDLNLLARPKVINYGKVHTLEELDILMQQFQVRFCVIDAQPERRKAYEFASRFYGRVRMAYYGGEVSGKQIHISDEVEPSLRVDRTSWLDLSLGRFRSQTITLPADTDYEYQQNIKAMVRTYTKDRHGNPVGQYISTKSDHYAHARNYAEIALPLALSLATSRNIPNYN